jgi:hypothetical protein
MLSWLPHALNGKCLSRASLSICKYCAVVSLDATIDDWFADLFKDIILAFILICNKVKCELISFFSVKYHDLVIQYLPDAPALLQALFT